jgi:hypothetical protein
MADAFSAIFGEETKKPISEGELVAPKKSPFANRNPQLKAEDDFDALFSDIGKQPVKTQQAPQTPQQQPKQDGSLAQTIGGNVAGAIDLLAGVPNFVGYGVGRAFGLTPQEAQKAASKVPEAIAQPVGRLTGLAQTEAYKQSIPVAVQNYIGEHLNESAQSIASKFNIPVEDAQALLEAGLTGVGAGVAKVTPKIGGMAKTAVKPMQEAFEKAKEKMPSVRMEKAPEALKGPELTRNIDQLQQQFEQQKAAGQAKPAVETVTSPTGEPIAQVDLGTSKPTTPDAPYTELSYSEKGLPLDEQYARAKVLQKVLGEDHAVDLAAIEGKGKERATNFDVSRSDTPQGNLLAERIADEQRRLSKYGEGLIKKTGGTLGLDEATLYKRGNTQLAPFEEYGNLLDKEIGKLYKERDKTAKEVPIQANFTKDLLNDDSIIQLADNEKLAKATTAKMKQLGIMDKDGNLLNTDAFKAEQLRKWLNEPNVWSPQNAGLHRALKDSIDNDVFAHADKAIYDDARKLFGLKKDTLDNPKGIATILDESGPNGINRKVDIEKVANKIAGMGVDQFTHIIDTLDKMPAELQPKAQKAKAEIKAQFLNQALAQKSPNKLTTYMNDNREVMNRLFTPEEMADIRDYHNASQILKTDVGYKGAAIQKINVEQKLMGKIAEQVAKKGGAAAAETALGGLGHGIPAALTHEYIAGKFEKSHAKKVAKAEEEAFKKTQERFVPIKDLLKLKPETTNRIELRNMAPGQPD